MSFSRAFLFLPNGFVIHVGMKKIIVTIDGWSSTGKSTLAKQLAKALGYIYVDSGAMYRAITLYFLRNHVDWTDRQGVKKALKQINIEFQKNPKTETSEVYLNGENVEYVIRDLVVAEKVSEIAAIRDGARKMPLPIIEPMMIIVASISRSSLRRGGVWDTSIRVDSQSATTVSWRIRHVKM